MSDKRPHDLNCAECDMEEFNGVVYGSMHGMRRGVTPVPASREDYALRDEVPKSSGQVSEERLGPSSGRLLSASPIIKPEAASSRVKLRKAFDDMLIAEVHRHGGIPHLRPEEIWFREVLAEFLLNEDKEG